jgi:hypothetical protein
MKNEIEVSVSLDDLDVALGLMVKLADLYKRLKKKEKANLLNIVSGVYSQTQSSDQISVEAQDRSF